MHLDGQNINVFVAADFHRLLVQDVRQRRDLVAQLGGLLKLEQLRVMLHFSLQLGHDVLRLTAQKPRSIGCVHGVLLSVDVPHARGRATLDLVQQARPGAVVEHRVLTGAQTENLLQQQDTFFHRPSARIRTKVMVLFFNRAAVVSHARKSRGGQLCSAFFSRSLWNLRRRELQIRVAFIVPEQNVEARMQRFDQVVFKQQRFGLRADHRGFHAHDARDHEANACATVVFLKIAGDALFQVARLAHVQHAAFRVKVTVHAGHGGQCSHFAEQLRGKFVSLGHGV